MEKQYDQFMATQGRGKNPVETMQDAAQGKIPPRLEKEIKAYKTVLNKLMHGKQTRNGTMEMLKSAPPEISVSQATLKITDQAAEVLESKGIKINDQVRLYGALHVMSDLVEIGNAAAGWDDPVDQQEAQLILKDTLQDYIHRGLADGTIDPIELQQKVEPMLSEEQRKIGLQHAQSSGVPVEVTQQQVLGNQRGVLSQRQQPQPQQQSQQMRQQ